MAGGANLGTVHTNHKLVGKHRPARWVRRFTSEQIIRNREWVEIPLDHTPAESRIVAVDIAGSVVRSWQAPKGKAVLKIEASRFEKGVYKFVRPIRTDRGFELAETYFYKRENPQAVRNCKVIPMRGRFSITLTPERLLPHDIISNDAAVTRPSYTNPINAREDIETGLFDGVLGSLGILSRNTFAFFALMFALFIAVPATFAEGKGGETNKSSVAEVLCDNSGQGVRERPQQTKGAMDFAMENIDDIIGQNGSWFDTGTLEWGNFNLGLFYIDFSGDTSSFPDSLINTNLYSTSDDTITIGYKERITAGPELPTTTGWDVSFKGVKGTQPEIEDRDSTETKTFHGDSANTYWIESKEIKFGYDWIDTVSIKSDYYPLVEDLFGEDMRIYYRGRDPPNNETYREIDVYGPVITWEFDTTTIDISESVGCVPRFFSLTAYPNPFNSAVRITVEGEEAAQIEIYDVAGRKIESVTELANKPHAVEVPDGLEVPNDAIAKLPSTQTGCKQGSGSVYVWRPAPSLPSGVYFVRARLGSRSLSGGPRAEPRGAETTVATKRIVYLK